MQFGLFMLHNPVEVAHRIAMLDRLARGRFDCGIGGGAIPTELALFGLDPSRPYVDRR
jgi:limonene 1,2-monooxygenase